MTQDTTDRSLTSNRKKKVALTAAALVVVTGGAALAYWTVGGTGTGTAATGTSTDVTVVQTTAVTPMFPGDAAQTLSGTFTNTSTGPVYVTTVTASIKSVFNASGTTAVGCDASDYTLANAAMPVGKEVPVGTSQGAWTGATIQFNNKATNQDACKGAIVKLAYVVS